jgi:hypothetical protein
MRLSLIIPALLLASCASSGPAPLSADQKRAHFEQQAGSGIALWGPQATESTRAAVARFYRGERLANGLPYGASMKRILVRGKHYSALEAELEKEGCRKIEDHLRDPKSHEPALCAEKKIPQVIFDCPDGGMVRIKPQGDPCSKFRPQPHSVKAVREPFNASVSDFSKEAFKVDDSARAIPKSPAELSRELNADEWAEDAHSDLK